MRRPKFMRVYGKVAKLSDMSTEDLFQVVEYCANQGNFEDPKEAAVELDRRLASKIRESVTDINIAIDGLYKEIRQVKADPTYKTHDYCESCQKWYPKGTHVPSEKCIEVRA